MKNQIFPEIEGFRQGYPAIWKQKRVKIVRTQVWQPANVRNLIVQKHVLQLSGNHALNSKQTCCCQVSEDF